MTEDKDVYLAIDEDYDPSEVSCIYVVKKEGEEPSLVPCKPGLTSDGYHTFDELYEHRCLLFCGLILTSAAYGLESWKSRKHNDGEEWAGWFVAGVNLEDKPITYHLPNHLWDLCHAKELEFAPPFDGHTSQDVLERLAEWLK